MPKLDEGLRYLLWLLFGTFIAGWLFHAGQHIGDLHELNHVSGAQLALVDWVRDGVLYPELFDGTRVGGTRFFPIPLLLHAGLASLVNDLVSAGKILNLISVATVAVMVGFIAHKLAGLDRLSASVMGCAVIASGVGLWMSTTVRHDSLATVFALGSLLLLARSRSNRRLGWAAGAFGAIAVFSRPTAAWAPLSLIVTSRKRTLWDIVLSGLVTSATIATVILVASRGRFIDTISQLFVGVTTAEDFLLAPPRLLGSLAGHAIPAFLLIPFAFLGWSEQGVRPFRTAMIVSYLIALISFTDTGVDFNHVFDPLVLTLVMASFGIGKLRQMTEEAGRTASSLTLLLVMALGLIPLVDSLDLVSADEAPSQTALATLIPEESYYLTEDPRLAVVRDEKPIVLDPFIVGRIAGGEGASARTWLTDKIRTQEFDHIVLLAGHGAPEDRASDSLHFYPGFLDAMEVNYCLTEERLQMLIYEPCT